MASTNTELKDHFPLNVMGRVLEECAPPKGGFDPSGDWSLTYGIYTFSGNGSRAGMLKLTRKTLDKDRAKLSVFYRKEAVGACCHQVHAEIECAADALATPARWEYRAVSLDPVGKPVRGTGIKKSAVVSSGAVEIRTGTKAIRIARSRAFTVNWNLFDVVQRLPRKEAPPLQFTMLDHFDQPKPEQRLSYWKSIRPVMGGKKVHVHHYTDLEKGRIRTTTWGKEGGEVMPLHGFSQVGRGIVPWVYWVDDSGRLLFVNAGLEGYVLDTPKESA